MSESDEDNAEDDWMRELMSQALEGRRRKGTLRRLPAAADADHEEDGISHCSANTISMIDFASNDYLGLAQDPEQHALVEKTLQQLQRHKHQSRHSQPQQQQQQILLLGATGSRLLSGDSVEFHQLERYLAETHRRPAALLCNSGYDANLTVMSSLPCDAIVYDKYAHNSIHMGMRLWQSANHSTNQDTNSNSNNNSGIPRRRVATAFGHNNVADLQRKLQQLQLLAPRKDHYYDDNNNNKRKIVVVVESVYSMDGDVAPLREILDTAHAWGAVVVVDEAHGLGVYGGPEAGGGGDGEQQQQQRGGTGVLAAHNLEQHPALHCSIHTFGKAAGCHGAVVCCRNATTKEYLINYGYPLIYSTALPLHSLVTIRCAYETMTGEKGVRLRAAVRQRVHQFRTELEPFLLLLRRRFATRSHNNDNNSHNIYLLPSTSPIQALMVPGNAACTRFCQLVWARSAHRVRLFPIKSPTVPVGQERVRIVLHAHNTASEVSRLVQWMVASLDEMDANTTTGTATTIAGSPATTIQALKQ